MKRVFGVGVAALLCLLPTAGMAGTFSGIVVTVEAGPGADEVTLHWSGGLAPYTVYRSTTPAMVASLSSVLAQTSSLSWTDLPAPGDSFFYEVTGTACADGTAEQVFSSFMQGCAGRATFANRNTPCSSGCRACTVDEWAANRGGVVPTHHYWTADVLGVSGTLCSCAVSINGPLFCPSGNSMLVCAPGGCSLMVQDPEGNTCNWNLCGFSAFSPTEYLGGCSGGTAGAVCCCS